MKLINSQSSSYPVPPTEPNSQNLCHCPNTYGPVCKYKVFGVYLVLETHCTFIYAFKLTDSYSRLKSWAFSLRWSVLQQLKVLSTLMSPCSSPAFQGKLILSEIGVCFWDMLAITGRSCTNSLCNSSDKDKNKNGIKVNVLISLSVKVYRSFRRFGSSEWRWPNLQLVDTKQINKKIIIIKK